MRRLTWRLLTTGLPLDFESQIDSERLRDRIRQRSAWRALRAKDPTESVAFRLRRDEFIASAVNLSVRALIRPVYFGRLDPTSRKITGKFLYSVLVRLAFWCLVGLAVGYEAIALNRVINLMQTDLLWDQLLGFYLLLLPPPVAIYIAWRVMYWFARKNAGDINVISDALQIIASE